MFVSCWPHIQYGICEGRKGGLAKVLVAGGILLSHAYTYRCIDFLLLQNNRDTHSRERERERVLDVGNSWPSSRYIIAYHQKQSISNLRLGFSSNDERVLKEDEKEEKKKRLDVCNHVHVQCTSDSCALLNICVSFLCAVTGL